MIPDVTESDYNEPLTKEEVKEVFLYLKVLKVIEVVIDVESRIDWDEINFLEENFYLSDGAKDINIKIIIVKSYPNLYEKILRPILLYDQASSKDFNGCLRWKDNQVSVQGEIIKYTKKPVTLILHKKEKTND